MDTATPLARSLLPLVALALLSCTASHGPVTSGDTTGESDIIDTAALASAKSKITRAPVDASATDNAKRLKQYLYDNYGTHIISGQMDTTWQDSMDMVGRVYSDTGRYPALKGFDFLNVEVTSYTGCGCASEQADEAIAWWGGKDGSTDTGTGKHGIVAFCWHWRVPLSPGGTSNPSTDAFYTSSTTFRIPMNANGTLNTASADFATLKLDVDTVATQLTRLQAAGVPVLWRPLHEASGGWFWWGASRTDGIAPAVAYKALWAWLYDYLTNTKGLHNLLWVWNAQSTSWYPGDATVDFSSDDVYDTPLDYKSDIEHFNATADASSSRMVALSENGTIPSPENLASDRAYWSWFMVWNDGGLYNSTTNATDYSTGITCSANFWTGAYYNADAYKKSLYNHSYVITLDELPDLTTYGD